MASRRALPKGEIIDDLVAAQADIVDVEAGVVATGSIGSAELAAGALSADATGRAIMAASFFNSEATVDAKFDAATIHGDRLVAASVNNAEIAAAAAIARSKLATETKAFRVPLASVLGATAVHITATEAAGTFSRSYGTNQLLLLGEISNGTVGADTEVSVGTFEFQLPPEYLDGGAITIRAGVDVTGAGALGTCTIDFEAFLQNGVSGAVGADLVTTAATAISATAANKDFVVNPTGLVSGDLLVIRMTTSVDNTNSTAIQAQIAALEVRCEVKG